MKSKLERWRFRIASVLFEPQVQIIRTASGGTVQKRRTDYRRSRPCIQIRTSERISFPRRSYWGRQKWNSTQRIGVNARQRCAKLPDKQKIRSPKEQCLGSRTITISSLANWNIAKDGRCGVLDIPRTGQFTDQASSAAYENPAIVAVKGACPVRSGPGS